MSDEVILSYLLHRAAQEEGSVSRIAKEAGHHAWYRARHLGKEQANVEQAAITKRVRELLDKQIGDTP